MQKSNFYEQSMHVPLAIHVPWLSRRQVRLDQPVGLVDLTPTLLDLLGVGVPAGLDGVSRAAALADPASWTPDSVVIEWHDSDDKSPDGRCLRTADNWKLNLYRGDTPELYDLNTDPGEFRNLARVPAHRERLQRLVDELRAWQQRHRDAMPLQT
jgi:choline-sulfatase